MVYYVAKEKLDELFEGARASVEAMGYMADVAVELVENQISDDEAEVLKVFGSLGIKTEELLEDDVFYLSVNLDVYEDMIDDEDYQKAVNEFNEALAEVSAKLEGKEDKTAAIKEINREIDDAIEEAYRLELERSNRAMKRDLTVAIIAVASLAIVALAFFVIMKVLG